MLIDWFTVGAQLLNFLILVWLMKRFLYQPVLDAITAREQKIAAELVDAAATQTRATQQQEEFRQKNEAFDEQRAGLLQQARDAAKAEGERLQVQAREAADAANAARAKALLADAEHLRADITRHTQEQVFHISRRVLGDLASVSLEQRASEVFIQRLRAMDGTELVTLGAALKAASDAEPALLRSAFELPEAQRSAIQTALAESFGQPVALKFQTAPELVSGIELCAQGQKLAWSISDYLAALSDGLEDRLRVRETA
ncbi:MAG TPA: F0F1 ATP synthase subunit B [Hydrogenophaga sp.]|uniref:F0F1 ATP synthase subunit delta n=1 Tax=Hydrogenophaga sp. TaxID=1904254 RepID=UPI0008AD2441|nr:F0F1 ATP synthase subunit delta [Hydrogenophaga sp.]OGA79655.1 MAG: F0F1 ATP synthase subunit B [Burkholderiales bacterium GWE1_65_30]OGA92688.1 MAG: F0F1 ATP synthase subunit B [Burkholderiales bacterium GWF1_66_17]HAX21947.1 F0F1 ATP synthase subunit B [Hydrogenophaga sp.]HBU21227.1 F0F1 ATP synthase subunit B [Hydrogenophaga sp.]